ATGPEYGTVMTSAPPARSARSDTPPLPTAGGESRGSKLCVSGAPVTPLASTGVAVIESTPSAGQGALRLSNAGNGAAPAASRDTTSRRRRRNEPLPCESPLASTIICEGEPSASKPISTVRAPAGSEESG